MGHVEIMSTITAYKSDADGLIFEDRAEYQRHLRRLARERRARDQRAAEAAKLDAVWAELYEREQSIDDWRQMVIDNQHLFWDEARRGDSYDWREVGRRRRGVVCPVPQLLEFTSFGLFWEDEVSNSHSCPHNGVTNWGGFNTKHGAPRGYPGWSGFVTWIYAWPREWDGIYLGSDLFSRGTFSTGRQRAHRGGGSGGGVVYSERHGCYVGSCGYSLDLFAADWPGLARYREKQVMWDALKREAA